MKKQFYIVFILLAFFISCASNENNHLVDKAEKILDASPDSALHLLHSIKEPNSMSKKYYMKYTVLDVLAKYKTYQDIKKDTVVFKAVSYFNRKSSINDKVLANYAAASVMNENEKYTDAMVYYKNDEKLLENSSNYLMKGVIYSNIAFLYDKQLMSIEAIKHFEKSLNEFSKLPNSQTRKINSLIFMGSEFLQIKQINKSLNCYNKAYSLSLEIEDQNSQSMILNNIGLIYQQKKEYVKAISYFKNAINFNLTDQSANNLYVLNLASNYLLINKIESVDFYLKTIVESVNTEQNLNYRIAVTFFLKNYYERRADYKKSLFYLEMNTNSQYNLFRENQSKALLDAEKKFDFTTHKAEAEKAKLMQRIYILFFVGIILLIAIASVVIWFRYSRQKLLEEMEIKSLKIKQQQQEIENQKLQGELGRFKYINITLNKVMEKANDLHFEIKDIVQAGILHEKSERHRKIQLKLKETQDTIKENIAFNAESFLIERSLIDKKILPKLTEEEKIILTMLFYKESRKNIASILSISPQAVYNRVPRLKNKLISLGFEDKLLIKFFDKEFSEE